MRPISQSSSRASPASGWVGVRRSNHSGAGSTYATIPVAHGMVGIYSAVSSSNFMAPWGGAELLLGTNPIAVGIPAGNEPPVVLDIATSVVSNGQIRTYANQGRPLPEGWVMSRSDGQPITDGKRLEEGMFVPMSTYKGSGLAIVLGLLGGPLNRAAFGRDVKDAAARRRNGSPIPAISSSLSTCEDFFPSTSSRPKSIATSTILPRRSGCPASMKSAFRGRGA